MQFRRSEIKKTKENERRWVRQKNELAYFKLHFSDALIPTWRKLKLHFSLVRFKASPIVVTILQENLAVFCKLVS